MTCVTDQTSSQLRAHMRRLQKMSGWHDPLADRLYKEILELDTLVRELRTAQAAAVPAGYALVPLEPTEAMLNVVASFPEHLRAAHPDPSDPWHEAMRIATAVDQAVVRSTWRAMLAAAAGDAKPATQGEKNATE